MLYWILEKMGFKKSKQEQIVKTVWRVMAVAFICGFGYALVKMFCQVFLK
jgi:nitrate reductase NapE component